MVLASLRTSLGLAGAMVAGISANVAMTAGLVERNWLLFVPSTILNVAMVGVSFRMAGIEFGGPELVWEQHIGEIVKAFPALVVVGFSHPVALVVPALDFPVYFLRITLHIVTGLNVRGAGLIVLALAQIGSAMWVILGMYPAGEVVTYIQSTVAIGLGVAVGVWTKYLHDQRLVFCMGQMQLIAGLFFYRYYVLIPNFLVERLFYPVLATLVCYLILLFQRRLRNLPPVLNAIRFTRLGFIRGDARCSSPIVRYQEMPPGAFGNVRKAMTLISASHRWLDHSTCDIPTPEFPMGLRLGTMRRVLNAHFSPTRAQRPSFAGRLRHALGRRAVGGWDAVVFFDFTGLPQVPRSEDEERTFRQCLPHMGMMYSMFPTMILPEVTPGIHGYLESGWCYCEFETAKLGKQLARYSPEAVGSLSRATYVGSPDNREADDVVLAMETELMTKRFHNARDADDVRRIISVFALKRLMLDAIEAGDMEQLRSAVVRLQVQQIAQSTLDQPVNKALDTLLHVAVRKGDVEATRVLIDCGASPLRRNLRGDVPAQRFMFPRCNSAATVARSRSPEAAGGEAPGRTAAGDAANDVARPGILSL